MKEFEKEIILYLPIFNIRFQILMIKINNGFHEKYEKHSFILRILFYDITSHQNWRFLHAKYSKLNDP